MRKLHQKIRLFKEERNNITNLYIENEVFMSGGNYCLLLGFLALIKYFPQETSIRGTVVDAATYDPLELVTVQINGTTFETITDAAGEFSLSSSEIPEGEIMLVFTKPGHELLRMPVVMESGQLRNLDLIPLQADLFRDQLQSGIINLAENQLTEDEGDVENIAGLLQATRDVFLNAAAFDFSQTFFRPRGLDSELSKVYINGIEMNKIFNGRPQWSNWGGLNDVQRNQVFTMGMVPQEVGFGGVAGSTNIIMRASKYGKGGRVSYAAANRSYTGRVMGTYHSGETPKGWAFSVSVSRRFAEEGYLEGSLYDANALFVSVEKRLSDSHQLNLSAFYTPNIRGKSSPNTTEVYDLRGYRYNSYWGEQEGEIRNSRIREIKEPVFMLNHYWELNENNQLNTNIAFQTGKVANSRIDYGGTRLVMQPDGQESFIGGGRNPDPAYYQNLPSYFLRFENNQNFEAAYRAREEFSQNGQIEWQSLYEANTSSAENGGNSVYVIAEDRNDDTQITANSIFTSTLNNWLKINAKVSYTRLISENFASVKDLLGGPGYLDVDFFAEGNAEVSVGDKAQSDLQNRNRLVTEGDRYKYNFELHASVLEGFSQLQFKFKKIDFYTAATVSQSRYQRKGIFQNGSFPNNSLGKSELLIFTNPGFKAGGTYRLTGRNLFDLNTGFYTRAPNLRNSFSNSRQNNEVIRDLSSEKISTIDFSYIFRTPHFRSRITGYFTQVMDATEVSFFYADGLSGLGRTSTTAFVQEVLTGINKEHLGVELGLDYQVTHTIKMKAAVALGQYIYSNNPNLYLTSDRFEETVDYGEASIKNYRLPGGPQRAAQVGFEYRDPNFWWFGTTVNFFSHAFADFSPLSRTSNFLTDSDGLPLLNYDESVARDLLKQEQFGNYVLVNAIGGKSWKIKNYYLGFFVSLNNIFDVLFKTGGFEQSRNANYRTLKEDRDRDHPIFGNKYWYGTGASYYANAYVRF